MRHGVKDVKKLTNGYFIAAAVEKTMRAEIVQKLTLVATVPFSPKCRVKKRNEKGVQLNSLSHENEDNCAI